MATGPSGRAVAPPRADSSPRPARPAFLLVLLTLFFIPWSVQVYAQGPVTILFAWGELGVAPLRVSTLITYLTHAGASPGWLLGWPFATLCHLLALGYVAAGVATSRATDSRLTVGLLVLAGLGLASFALGFSAQPGRTAFPLGAAALWLVAGWYRWIGRA